MLEIYQNLPLHLSPIAFSVGLFEIRWYSLMYLVCFLVVYFLLSWRLNRKEFYGTKFKIKFEIIDLMIYFTIGSLLGGRLGYVLFYNFQYFLHNPLAIISPFQLTDTGIIFSGISGMSYHGGLFGAVLAGIIFTKKYHLNFWWLMSWVAPAVPAGYFFGRIGNFLNGELYGRITDSKWGMFFNNETFLRHPSQLYEAFFEGIFLFVVLWILRNKYSERKGFLAGLYLIGYGTIRFLLEFFRQPDEQLGFIISFLTMGQLLSIIMIILGVFIVKRSWK